MGDDPSQPSVSNTNHRKELNRSRFDRFVKKVGQKLLPKPCDTIFVPSSIASGPSCASNSHSTDSEQSSIYDGFYISRKTSAPASVGTTLPELSINTFGGEAAGSGYGWINTPGVGEPYHGVESVIKAQQLGLQMVNERIEWTKEQIDLCCNDEKMIAEFVAEAFVEELNAVELFGIARQCEAA
uniref:Transcription repressor n=1 Tax=Angiostrongylus cantonensis TaxID=6313 RepID=A0A0K0D9G4_ANGCA